MAIATLYNLTVQRVFGANDQGASAYAEVTIERGANKGEKFKQYFTLWAVHGESFEFDEGDVIKSVTGNLSSKVETYTQKDTGEEKTISAVAINDAEVVLEGGGSGYADDEEDEGWDD